MGSARHSRPDCRFRPAMERKDGDRRVSIDRVAENGHQQVLRLEGALWESERAKRLDSARPLAGRVGKGSDHRFSSGESIGGLSASDIHDAGPGCRGRESVQCVESIEQGRAGTTLEQETISERHRVPATSKTARALACRRFLHQHLRHVLLPVQCSGWRQPLHRALGDPRIDERTGGGNHSPAGSRDVPGSEAEGYIGQRASIRCEGLQGIHPHLRDDACENIAVLSAIEWEDRAMAQVHKGGVHPSGRALVAGGCAADRGPVGNPLQYGAASQRDRLHCAPGQAATTGSRDLRRTRSQTRSGSPTTTTAPQQQSGCDLWTGKRSHSKLSAPGEAEAGSAGTQPYRGIAWWAHRHDENGGMRFGLRVPRLTSSDDRPPCLKKSNKQMAPFLISPFLKPKIRQKGRASSRSTCRTNVDPGRRSYPPDHQPFGSVPNSYLTKNGTSPFHAEPRQNDNGDVPPHWRIPVNKLTGLNVNGVGIDPMHKEVMVPTGNGNVVMTFFFPEMF